MILAIMQPYFFPYIGYWQLLRASTDFVLLDDVQYIRHGWINRNRILKPGGGWQYILVPLNKHGKTALIREVRASPNQQWKDLIMRQLAHYKKTAPYFDDTVELVNAAIADNEDAAITAINLGIIRVIGEHLGITTNVTVSSERSLDYSHVSSPGDWALHISEQLGASEYINPIGGAPLFDQSRFAAGNIRLTFLRPHNITYPQGSGEFQPALSIIDVLMFNGLESTKQLLSEYSLEFA